MQSFAARSCASCQEVKSSANCRGSDHRRAWLRLDSADTGPPPQPYERLTTRNH